MFCWPKSHFRKLAKQLFKDIFAEVKLLSQRNEPFNTFNKYPPINTLKDFFTLGHLSIVRENLPHCNTIKVTLKTEQGHFPLLPLLDFLAMCKCWCSYDRACFLDCIFSFSLWSVRTAVQWLHCHVYASLITNFIQIVLATGESRAEHSLENAE